eukprot:944754-Rhodomonas_salina.1
MTTLLLSNRRRSTHCTPGCGFLHSISNTRTLALACSRSHQPRPLHHTLTQILPLKHAHTDSDPNSRCLSCVRDRVWIGVGVCVLERERESLGVGFGVGVSEDGPVLTVTGTASRQAPPCVRVCARATPGRRQEETRGRLGSAGCWSGSDHGLVPNLSTSSSVLGTGFRVKLPGIKYTRQLDVGWTRALPRGEGESKGVLGCTPQNKKQETAFLCRGSRCGIRVQWLPSSGAGGADPFGGSYGVNKPEYGGLSRPYRGLKVTRLFSRSSTRVSKFSTLYAARKKKPCTGEESFGCPAPHGSALDQDSELALALGMVPGREPGAGTGWYWVVVSGTGWYCVSGTGRYWAVLGGTGWY